jgi:DNA-binding CsgD family transcriptional regulator
MVDRRSEITTASLSLARLQDPKLWVGLQRDLRLSDRELQVAVLLVLGRSLRQIGESLQIKTGTVHTYCERIKRKAGQRNRARLVTALWLASGHLLGDNR